MDFSLRRMEISGFKSLRHLDLGPGSVTVLIGSNGSGKSNIVSAFEMLAHMRTGTLSRYLLEHGPASTLLHYGSKTTPVLDVALEFGRGTPPLTMRHALVTPLATTASSICRSGSDGTTKGATSRCGSTSALGIASLRSTATSTGRKARRSEPCVMA